MRNAGNKKLLLVLLALALLTCSVMALGGTFAGQVMYSGENTDLSANNELDYKVDIQFYNPSTNQYDQNLLSSSALGSDPWCPGYTKIIYLKVTNREAFPVDCTLDMVVTETGFGNMLRYAVINQNLKADDAEHPADWDAFSVHGSTVLTKATHSVFEKDTLGSGESRYYALAIHMDENAGNQYQNQRMDMTFNFRVNADYSTGENPTN